MAATVSAAITSTATSRKIEYRLMRSFLIALDRAFTLARFRSLRRCRFACVAIFYATPRLASDARR